MTAENAKSMLEQFGTNFRKGGRIAYWNLYVNRNSENQITNLKRLDKESESLHRKDRVWFYRSFWIEEII